MVQTIAFIIISFLAFSFAYKKYKAIYQAITLGKRQSQIGQFSLRLKNMLLFALGQRKMFTRPVAGVFHLFIYVAFIITQLEAIEIFADGFLGYHRLFAGKIGVFYAFIINFIEALSVLALIATLVFLIRRNVIKIKRFQNSDLNGWPALDANLILLGEIILVTSIFMMNGAEQVLQLIKPETYHPTGTFYLSANSTMIWLRNLPFDWLQFMERLFWWSHYLVVLGFLVYLPYSKHLHIFLAFPTSFYSDLSPRGQMSNIPAIENEVRSMLELPLKENIETLESFGAKDINDLPWTTILQSFSCTECGRCTSVCPANITGKKLSPRKIVMDIRDRAELIVRTNAFKFDSSTQATEVTDGFSLFDQISAEELYACTSCNACVEACPVLINPLQPILELRRYDILMNSGGPQAWLPMFNSLENNQSVWAMSEPRTQWIQN
ncbi:MAG: (Fe-S)-binding protein [Saprospiraceae bacterium]|nr:(Fe-S)-binding protein [Saprospiraceae bacterium]